MTMIIFPKNLISNFLQIVLLKVLLEWRLVVRLSSSGILFHKAQPIKDKKF